MSQERGHSFSPNYQGFYYLRTAFTADELSLESNGSASGVMNGASFMSSKKGATGTMWKLVPDTKNKGWYRLKSRDQGDGRCLEANVAGGKKEGRSFMDACRDVSGQLWRLDLVTVKNGDHLYRLRTKLHGNDFSLEGNKPDNKSVYSGNTFMDKTLNVSGQMWRLVPVK